MCNIAQCMCGAIIGIVNGCDWIRSVRICHAAEAFVILICYFTPINFIVRGYSAACRRLVCIAEQYIDKYHEI